MSCLKGSTGVILRASTAENCCQKLPFSTEPWTLFSACRLKQTEAFHSATRCLT